MLVNADKNVVSVNGSTMGMTSTIIQEEGIDVYKTVCNNIPFN